MKNESKLDRLYNALRVNREKLTPRQISARYRVANAYDLIYRLRSEGYIVHSRKHVNSRGELITRYSM